MGRNRNFEFANFGELIEEDEMWNPFVEEVVATALAYDGDHRFRIRLFIKDETETRFEPVGDVYFRNSHFRGEKPVSNIESVVKQCRKKLQDNPGEDWPVDGMKGTFRMRASNTTTTDPLKTLTGYIKGQKGMAERELDLRLAAYDHIFMRVQQMGDAMPEMLRSLSERDKAITEMVKGTATAQKEVVSMAVDLIRGESAIDVTPEEDDEPDGTVVSILKSVMGLVVSDEQSRKMLGAGADARLRVARGRGRGAPHLQPARLVLVERRAPGRDVTGKSRRPRRRRCLARPLQH